MAGVPVGEVNEGAQRLSVLLLSFLLALFSTHVTNDDSLVCNHPRFLYTCGHTDAFFCTVLSAYIITEHIYRVVFLPFTVKKRWNTLDINLLLFLPDSCTDPSLSAGRDASHSH